MGAGVAGLCTAAALAEKGKKVTVVGRSALAGEASPRAAGIIDPFLGHNKLTPLLKLTLEAYKYFPSYIRRLERISGINVEYKKVGMVYIAMTKKEAGLLKSTFEWQKQFKMPMKWLEGQSLRKKFPFVSPSAAGGLYYPTMGRINPILFVKACERYARNKGTIILKSKGEATLSLRDGSYTTRCGKIKIQGPLAVIASGAWSPTVSNFKKYVPVKPARGQMFVGTSGLRLSTIIHAVHDAYLVPRESGDYLLGSTVEFAGYSAATTQEAKKKILSRLTSIIPALNDVRITDAWAGLRPWSRDLKPIIGEIPGTGLYTATGYFRSGLLLGPFCGSRLSDIIEGEKTPKLLEPFTPKRFEK